MKAPNLRFLQYLAALKALRSSNREAYNLLVVYWSAGVNIPGYEGQNKQPNMPLPRGWSYSSIARLLSSLPKVEFKQERRGDVLCLVVYSAGVPLAFTPVCLPSPPVLL